MTLSRGPLTPLLRKRPIVLMRASVFMGAVLLKQGSVRMRAVLAKKTGAALVKKQLYQSPTSGEGDGPK